MINVPEQPEPATFDALVRRPGNQFLALNINRRLRSDDWDKLWKHCVADLRLAYNGICAYTASFVPTDVDSWIGSVDHFIPKSIDRSRAYEWENYRFCTPRINKNKDNSTRVMDPFHIRDGWFELDFDTYLVKPADGLPNYLSDAIQNTIDDLKLNDDDRIVQSRSDHVQEYIEGHVDFDFLERRFPFIAAELNRQGLAATIKARASSSKP